jgi:hypothetical protein
MIYLLHFSAKKDTSPADFVQKPSNREDLRPLPQDKSIYS